MKNHIIKFTVVAFLIFLNACKTEKSNTKENVTSTEERLYLGQKPPSLIPAPFVPGIIATDEYLETEVLFSSDMKELSFTRSGGNYKEPKWILMEFKDKEWIPKPISPAEISKFKEQFSPSISEIKKLKLFKDIPIIGFTVSSSGTIYFYVLDFNDGSGYLSYSSFINGKYEAPIKMNESINSSGKYIAHPFVSPDESYILWDAESENENNPDIYISFRNKDGSWGEAINLGDKINTRAYEQRAKVTPDGKYLFFWRGDRKVKEDGSSYFIGSPYWVDAKIIETLRPQ